MESSQTSSTDSPSQARPLLLPVAIQGVAGSFHELAARQFFGPDLAPICCDSFPELFRQLAGERHPLGVVAIENSVAGTILPNYGLIRDSGLRIFGEVYLRISHMLMALPGVPLDEIREVHSHAMALQQCLNYLETLPGVKLVESDDTAASAERIATQRLPQVAAVASRLAAEHYGLQILTEAIEDDPSNYTRFFLIGTEEQAKRFALSAPDKASLCFSLGHAVGSLSQILMVLSAHGMNLTKIQSSPIVGSAWEYFFHLDLEFDAYDQYQRAIAAILPLVKELKVMGEYPRAEKTPL